MDVNQNYVNHFATSIKSLCCPPKTNTMLHVTFIPLKVCKRNQ